MVHTNWWLCITIMLHGSQHSILRPKHNSAHTFFLQVSLGQMYRHEKLVIEKTRWYIALKYIVMPNAHQQRATWYWTLTSSRTLSAVCSTYWQSFCVKLFYFLSCCWCEFISLMAIYFHDNPIVWKFSLIIYVFLSCESTEGSPKIRLILSYILFDFQLRRE